MSVKLLAEHHLEFLRLKGGCTGSSDSILVKIPHCWKSNVTAHIHLFVNFTKYVFRFLTNRMKKWHSLLRLFWVESFA